MGKLFAVMSSSAQYKYKYRVEWPLPNAWYWHIIEWITKKLTVSTLVQWFGENPQHRFECCSSWCEWGWWDWGCITDSPQHDCMLYPRLGWAPTMNSRAKCPASYPAFLHITLHAVISTPSRPWPATPLQRWSGAMRSCQTVTVSPCHLSLQ